MKDKDKLWLVFHLDVEAIDEKEISDYVREVEKHFRYDDSVQVIVVPVRGYCEHPIEVLQTPCVLFQESNNGTKVSLKD